MQYYLLFSDTSSLCVLVQSGVNKVNGSTKQFPGPFSMTYLLELTIMKIYRDHKFAQSCGLVHTVRADH